MQLDNKLHNVTMAGLFEDNGALVSTKKNIVIPAINGLSSKFEYIQII